MASADVSLERKLPYNPEAERSVLGAILLDNQAFHPTIGLLQPADFFRKGHRRIFARMIKLSEENRPIDLITLHEELERAGELDAAGGSAYLSSLVDGVPRVTNVEYYARIVKEKARLRNLIRAANEIGEQASGPEAEAGALSELATLKFQELRQAHGHTRPAAIAFASAQEFLARRSEDERHWLIQSLLPARSQTIWQGRPKVGKSHTLLQLAFDLASGLPIFAHFPVPRSCRVAYIELEEPEGETKQRFATMLRAHRGNGPDGDKLFFFSRDDLYRHKLLSRELLGGHLKEFCAAVRDVGAELVILVALRKLLSGDRNDQEVAEIFNDALDALAQETGAAIVLAHHDRKAPADTAEARGLGSTMFSARADAIFDFSRTRDRLRRIDIEARYDTLERFYLRREAVGDGQLIRLAEAPADAKEDKRKALLQRVGTGESIHKAAQQEGIPYSTARRWISDGQE